MSPIYSEFVGSDKKVISSSYTFIDLTFFQIIFPVLTLFPYLSQSSFRHNFVIYYFNPKMVRECYMKKKNKLGNRPSKWS